MLKKVSLLCTLLILPLFGQIVEERPLVQGQVTIDCPHVITEFNRELTEQEHFFLKQKGYSEFSPLQAQLTLINPHTLLMTGGFSLADAKGNPQYAKLEKQFNLYEYLPSGHFHIEEYPDHMVLDEEIIQYSIPFVDESQKNSVLAFINQAIDNLPEDQLQRETPNSEIAEMAGFTHLVHTTRPENLIKILESGKLKPGSALKNVLMGDPIGNHGAVFFSLLESDDKFSHILKGTGNRMPILVFNNISILDQAPFHSSIGFPYGSFINLEISDHAFSRSAHYRDMDSFRHFAFNPHAKLGNEVVLYDEVPLKGLMTIIVKKGTKNQYIDELNKANIQPPNHLTWEDLFVEIPALMEDRLPEYNRYSNHWLKPYSANSDDLVRYAFQQRQLNGPDIINQLVREYPGLKDLYDQSAQVHEGYSIKDHTLRVFQEFEKVFIKTPLDKRDYAEITPDLEKVLRTMLALHDIGKGLGKKEDQHKNTTPILQTAMERWGFRYSEIRLATALVNHDLIGEMLKDKKMTPQETIAKLQNLADYANLSLEPFLKLQVLFWLSDAGSYPFLKMHVLKESDRYGRLVPADPRWNALLTLAAEQTSKPIKEVKQVEMPLFPLYDLEVEDPLHRYGLEMQNQHDLYEQTLVKNPDWKWRDKFWEWLDTEGPGKTIPKVTYLNEKDRQKYRVNFKKGKLQIPVNYDENTELLYVLDNKGNFFSGTKDRGSVDRKGFFHSSFLAGAPVVGCGIMHCDVEGNLLKIDDHSGHYRPSEQQIFQTLKFLQSKGVDLSHTTLEFEALWEARLHKQKHNIPLRAPINALDWFKIKNWKVFTNRSLQQTLDEVRDTQKIVSSPKPLVNPNNKNPEGHVLVLISTENPRKLDLIRERFTNENAVVEIKTVPWNFGYQQQAYNGAGELAARKRGEYAEDWLKSPDGQNFLKDHPFESIYWVAMVNYIQLDSKKKNPPIDYGLIMVKNVNTGAFSSTITEGVTVDPRFVEEAMRYGYLPEHRYGNHDYSKDKHWDYDTMPGNVRVGKVLTTHVYNLKNDDWHAVVANKSRYDILSDSIKTLTIP